MKYHVTVFNEKNDDEFVILTTEKKEEAIERARDEKYYIERDKRKNDHVEIRMYQENIDSDDCICFDYSTIDF